MTRSVAREKSYAFALRIVGLARVLRERREFEIARQVLRSGTSIGANVEEAQAGISRPDFVAKMSIASKEARETRYWLRLLLDSKIGPTREINEMLVSCEEIVRILTAVVKTGQAAR